jgi:hypothetical protein
MTFAEAEKWMGMGQWVETGVTTSTPASAHLALDNANVVS